MIKFKKYMVLFYALFIYHAFISNIFASGDIEEDYMFFHKNHYPYAESSHYFKHEHTTEKIGERKFFNFGNVVNKFSNFVNNFMNLNLRISNAYFYRNIVNSNLESSPNYVSEIIDEDAAKKDPMNQFKEIQKLLEESKKTTKRILVIDGGGIRGVIPAQILSDLEDELSRTIGHKVYIGEYFDLIAGTSTGGIIALALSVPQSTNGYRKPQYKASQILELYKNEGKKIFPFVGLWNKRVKDVTGIDFARAITPKFSQSPLEEILATYFKNYKLKNAISKVLVTAYSTSRNQPIYFRSYEDATDVDKTYRYLMKEAARATSAAPTYFGSAEIIDYKGAVHKYIDGGVSINNPTLAAILEAQEIFKNKGIKRYVVLSLGTGEAPFDSYSEDIENGGMAQYAQHLPNIMMGGAAKLVDKEIDGLQKILNREKIEIKHLRIQTQLSKKHMELDNADLQNVDHLIHCAKDTYNKHREYIQYFINDIVEEERKIEFNYKKILNYCSKYSYSKYSDYFKLYIPNVSYKLSKLKLKQKDGVDREIIQYLYEAASEKHLKASYMLAKIAENQFDKISKPRHFNIDQESYIIESLDQIHKNFMVLQNECFSNDLYRQAICVIKCYLQCMTDDIDIDIDEKKINLKSNYRLAIFYNKMADKFLFNETLDFDERNKKLNQMLKLKLNESYEKYLSKSLDLERHYNDNTFHKPTLEYAKYLMREKNNYEQAEKILFSLWNHNYSIEAAYELGQLYENHKKDKSVASSWYEKAANLNHARAQYWKAQTALEEDKKEEFKKWIFKSSCNGYLPAQLKWGFQLWEDNNIDDAENYLKKINHPVAYFYLGVISENKAIVKTNYLFYLFPFLNQNQLNINQMKIAREYYRKAINSLEYSSLSEEYDIDSKYKKSFEINSLKETVDRISKTIGS